MSRGIETVKVYPKMPDDSVAVYGLVASNGTASELQTAVQHKAAHLGCDGVVIAEYTGAGKTRGVKATGQLNEHRELANPRLLALCVVLASAEGTPGAQGTPEAGDTPQPQGTPEAGDTPRPHVLPGAQALPGAQRTAEAQATPQGNGTSRTCAQAQ